MDATTFETLVKMRERHPKEFGKVCQVLLAMTFCRLGFRRVVERSVQGVDIDVSDHSSFGNFSIEVKTTDGNSVSIQRKDIIGLENKAKDGYETAFAVLRVGLLFDWVIASARGIGPGDILVGRFESRTLPDLQDAVRQTFPQVLSDHSRAILSEGANRVQTYMQKSLAEEKRKATAGGVSTPHRSP